MSQDDIILMGKKERKFNRLFVSSDIKNVILLYLYSYFIRTGITDKDQHGDGIYLM
jgi:hypothetical protein